MRRIYVGDGGSFVWQWQPKEQIVLEDYPEGVFVHYANCDTVEAPVVQTRMEGNKLVADIPPELMQVDKDITVYVCDVDGTMHCHFLSVLSRPKPESYVIDPVEVLRYESLAERVAALEKGGSGGISEEKDPTVPAWAKAPQKPTYTAEEVGALPKDTKIPGKTSELTNDAGFVDKAVNDLANYYTRQQTQELIAAIPRFRVTVVQQLPAAGEELVLYLVPFATAEGQYLEYIWVDGRWEIIGSQRVDLTGYATEVWVKDYVAEHFGQNVKLDTTLTKSGEAADAKAVGDEIKRVEGLIPSIEGLAKTEDIPTKPEDIGAQPKGNYLTSAPVTVVNGKTGEVILSASDVGARPDTWMPTALEVGALPNTYTPPNQTAEQVGADPKGTAASAVSAHNTSNTTHSDIRQELAAINARLTAFFDSDNQTLDELSEIVAYITSNKSLIDAITTSKVSVVDIVNDLTTNVANKPLSAAQGVAIKGLIDGLSTGKLDASTLQEAINTALAQAKASGEFDGVNGSDAAVTVENITKALGYVPASVAAVFDHTENPTFTNLLDEAGIEYGKLIDITNKTVIDTAATLATTGFIPIRAGDTGRVNEDFPLVNSGSTGYILYDADKNPIQALRLDSILADAYYVSLVESDSDGYIRAFRANKPSSVAYIRICNNSTVIGPNPILAVNEEIRYEMGYGQKLNPAVKVEHSQIVNAPGRHGWNILPHERLNIAYSAIGRKPINTVAHFTDAAENFGYNVLKCDVRPTSDGELVCCHDAGFTFDSNGYITTYSASNSTAIHDVTAATVLGYSFKTGDHPCLVGDYLDVCRKYGKVAFVTIRNEYMDVVIPKLLEELRIHNMTHSTIINCMTYDSLVMWRQQDQTVMINYTLNAGVAIDQAQIDRAVGLGYCSLCGFGLTSSALEPSNTCDFDYARANGIRLLQAIAYKEGSPEACYAMGYDGCQIGYAWNPKATGGSEDTYSKDEIDAIMGSYITDIDALVGGDG